MKSKLKVKYSPDADAMVITVRSGKPDYGDEKAPGVIMHFKLNHAIPALFEIET